MDATITIYVSTQDKDLIKKAAELVHLNMSVFCKYIIFKHINRMGEKL